MRGGNYFAAVVSALTAVVSVAVVVVESTVVVSVLTLSWVSVAASFLPQAAITKQRANTANIDLDKFFIVFCLKFPFIL